MAGGVTLTVTNLTDARKVAKKVAGSEGFGLYAATQWHRLYTKFVPWDTGSLADHVTFAPFEITHNEPYAGYQYYGARQDGSHAVQNYSRDKHGLASSHWDDAAVPTQKEKLERSLTKFLGDKVVVE